MMANIMEGRAPVTVVVPCFRNEQTIARAIESVAQQTVRPAEVIVIDDASGDGTAEHVREIAKYYPDGWITVLISQDNRGAATARNIGWNRASQPFVAFLDADDTWHPRKIELQCAFMARHQHVVLSGHGHVQTADPSTRNFEKCAEVRGSKTITKARLLLSNRFITPSVILKRDIPYRFAEGKRYMEDHLLWLQIACDGAVVVRLNAELAFIHKAPFGEAGLSSHLWAMEKGELANYWQLMRERRLGVLAVCGLSFYSLLKFGRRLILSSVVAPLG